MSNIIKSETRTYQSIRIETTLYPWKLNECKYTITNQSFYPTAYPFDIPKERFKIVSIIRISDNELFSIGDQVYYDKIKANLDNWETGSVMHYIDNFFLREDGLMLARSKQYVENGYCARFEIDNYLTKNNEKIIIR